MNEAEAMGIWYADGAGWSGVERLGMGAKFRHDLRLAKVSSPNSHRPSMRLILLLTLRHPAPAMPMGSSDVSSSKVTLSLCNKQRR